MKKLAVMILCALLLCGCQSSNSDIGGAMDFRQKVSNAKTCQFDCRITADYSDKLYAFELNCTYDQNRSLQFSVSKPESIQGISGYFDREGGFLTFDDKLLAFPMLADGQLSPVSAPWLFMKSICGGYIRGSGRDGDNIHMIIDDSYEENPLQIDIWTDDAYIPFYCEILWQGRRILSLEIENFSCV